MNSFQRFKLILTSTILFLSGFIIAYIPFQMLTILCAKIFSIPTGFSFYKVKFLIPSDSLLWSPIAIITIYGVPPIISLLLAIFTRKIYEKAKRRRSNFKLFLIWLSLHLDNFFWGSISAGIITSSGFAYFLNWMYIPYFVQIIMAVLGLFLLWSLKDFAKITFLQSSPHKYLIDKSNQLKYKISIAYIPYLIGTGIFIAVSFPDNSLFERIINITLFITLLPISRYYDTENIKLTKGSTIFSPNWIMLIFVIVYLLTFQILL